MKRRGRPVLGVISGLLLGLLVSLDLLVFEVRALDTIGIVVIPLAGLVLGLILGLTAPFGRRKGASAPPATQEMP